MKPRNKFHKKTFHTYEYFLLGTSVIIFQLLFIQHLLYSNHHDTFKASIQSQKLQRNNPLRILHIVTSVNEYETIKEDNDDIQEREDRLLQKLIPILQTSIHSFLDIPNWSVDVYLILGYPLSSDRNNLIRQTLPPNVGLEIWEDAIPFYYTKEDEHTEETVVEPQYASLARQHRFVIKDKLNHYDFFSAWEDDMMITSGHIQNFLEMSQEIENMKKEVMKEDLESVDLVYGALTEYQINQLIPGFIRVEVVENELLNKVEKTHEMVIPPGPSVVADGNLDPTICCQTKSYSQMEGKNDNLHRDQIQLWETDVKAMGMRKLPGPLGWVSLLPRSFLTFRSYWSGDGGEYGNNNKRPQGFDPKYFAQQAGFMATKEKILFLDSVCRGGFLPPFRHFYWEGHSGLRPHNVEFWSGGFQLFGRCKMQRIISLDPKRFSRQLLYHASNNKQRTLDEKRFIKANDLLGQLRTVRDRCKNKFKETQIKE